MEYFAFGETFIEEHKNSHNAPYKYNGKELDEESGLYYYGARYYDPRLSLWNSTDPLSGFNPVFEEEHYFDGEHNGGLENSFNHSTYSYCYQSPIILLDPDGKQVKSKYLDDTWIGDYGFGNSFGNGIADGMIDASPLGMAVFIKDIITKPEVREQLFEGIQKIMDDPSGTVKEMFTKKIDAWSNVLNGGGTEQEKYDVGNDIGNTLGALLTGGGLVKLFKSLKKKGVIYEVPGSATKSGKPYVGKSDVWDKRKKYSADGRDRSKAKVVGKYDINKPKAGSIAEQKRMNKKGGKDALDNKRLEIKKSDWKKYGIKPPK